MLIVIFGVLVKFSVVVFDVVVIVVNGNLFLLFGFYVLVIVFCEMLMWMLFLFGCYSLIGDFVVFLIVLLMIVMFELLKFVVVVIINVL